MLTDQYLDGMIAGMVPMYRQLKLTSPDKYAATIELFQKEARIDPNAVSNEGRYVPKYGGYPKHFYIEVLKALGEPLVASKPSNP
jgi:hypothetical protein